MSRRQDRKRQQDSFDAFLWMQRNRVRNALKTPVKKSMKGLNLAFKNDGSNEGLIRTTIVNERRTVNIERRK